MIPNPFDALIGMAKDVGVWIAVLVLLFVFLVAPPWIAYRLGWNARDNAAQIEARASEVVQLQELVADHDYNARLAGDYYLRRGATALVFQTLRVEVPRVVSHYIRVPGEAPVPVPACVFTRGFERVWNQALQSSADAKSGSAAGADPAIPRTGAAEAEAEAQLYDSGLDQADVLDNHLTNAEVAKVVRDQCEGLRAWALGRPR